MPPNATITSLEFYNFKALQHFSVALQHMNVLVGPNNCGKSTVLSALRVLAEGLRRARARSAERVLGPLGDTFGYRIPADSLPISVENVHTDYSETETRVVFRISNRNTLQLYFPPEGGCNLLTEVGGRPTRTPSEFRNAFPISIGIVPVLGPLEHEEGLVNEETVRRGLATHRASRHFRNYWRYNPDGFAPFADLVSRTWPGMQVEKPELIDAATGKLAMFAMEGRILRELFWSGFGFQIWCQLLTHISRATDDSLLVIDEPEIYLHPDVQRQLLGILRATGPDIVLATHSTEVIAEADPSDILLIDKAKRSAQRLKDIEGVQAALDAVGSLQNITLTQLARNRKILFLEGASDYRLLRRFARQTGYSELASGNDLTLVESGGFTSWERVKDTAWGIEKTIGKSLKIAAVFDRDYFPAEEIDTILRELRQHLEYAHIHHRKEIENSLLVPEVLERAIGRVITERSQRIGEAIVRKETASELLERITAPHRGICQGQYMAKRTRYLIRDSRDEATINTETIEWFDSKWNDLSTRMEVVPGKLVLKALRDELQALYGVNLTDFRIIDEFRNDDIPLDLRVLLKGLEAFRTG